MARAMLILTFVGVVVSCRPSPEAALAEFRSANVPECAIARPLVLAGRKVVPLVVAAIEDRQMPRRRYAVAALGSLGDTRAVDPLFAILSNPEEKDVFRADALQAINKLDGRQGAKLASEYLDRDGLLGEYAFRIANGSEWEGYGYWDAVFSRQCR